MQHILIEPKNPVYEQWRLEIENPDDGNFVLSILNKNSNPPQFWRSEKINALSSANRIRGPLSRFYRKAWGADCTVERQWLDKDGKELASNTRDKSLIKKAIYTITSTKLIDGPSFEKANVIPGTSKSLVKIIYPE